MDSGGDVWQRLEDLAPAVRRALCELVGRCIDEAGSDEPGSVSPPTTDTRRTLASQ